MTETTTETWLDHMSAIPLARAVPVVDADGRKGNVAIVLRGRLEAGGEGCSVLWDDAGDQPDIHPLHDSVELRVDLDDPQGQRCAVNHWLSLTGALIGFTTLPWVIRLLRGEGTESDCLRLAKALREVTP